MKIAVIGGGAMGGSLIGGWLASGVSPEDIIVADPSPGRREELGKLGISVCQDNIEAARTAETILLAVKPQVAKTVLTQLAGVCQGRRLLSIVAGLETATVEEHCHIPVIRAMPNNPCRVLEGAVAICPGKLATEEDLALAEKLFSAVGLVVRVTEELMDAVTGLSGSGPAFVYLVVEALSDGGVLAGLPRQVSTELAIQTVLGAARTLKETGLHAATLKEEVTSPAGTTIWGLAELEKRGVRSAMMEAVASAAQRSKELGTKETGN
jgi:pyrroline-5-carboxylate reductase